MCKIRRKEVCYEKLDYESRLYNSKPPLFQELTFLKKVNKAMKMFTKQYCGYKFTYLIGANILQIVSNFITYSILT